MDDQPSTVSQDCSQPDAELSLDTVTAELKAEFAKLEKRRRRLEENLYVIIDSEIDRAVKGISRRNLYTALDAALHALRSLDDFVSVSGETAQTKQHKKFCADLLRAARDGLANLNALLACSLRATLRTPLLLDGPELSGYKHRLR